MVPSYVMATFHHRLQSETWLTEALTSGLSEPLRKSMSLQSIFYELGIKRLPIPAGKGVNSILYKTGGFMIPLCQMTTVRSVNNSPVF